MPKYSKDMYDNWETDVPGFVGNASGSMVDEYYPEEIPDARLDDTVVVEGRVTTNQINKNMSVYKVGSVVDKEGVSYIGSDGEMRKVSKYNMGYDESEGDDKRGKESKGEYMNVEKYFGNRAVYMNREENAHPSICSGCLKADVCSISIAMRKVVDTIKEMDCSGMENYLPPDAPKPKLDTWGGINVLISCDKYIPEK